MRRHASGARRPCGAHRCAARSGMKRNSSSRNDHVERAGRVTSSKKPSMMSADSPCLVRWRLAVAVRRRAGSTAVTRYNLSRPLPPDRGQRPTRRGQSSVGLTNDASRSSSRRRGRLSTPVARRETLPRMLDAGAQVVDSQRACREMIKRSMYAREEPAGSEQRGRHESQPRPPDRRPL